MGGRLRLASKRKSKSRAVGLVQTPLRLFGEPQLLEGEDAAAYEELLSRMRAAVKPLDIIDEMFVDEVMALEWEVLRWRRLKSGLIRARVLEALEDFLSENLDADCYRDHFTGDLIEILKRNLPEAQAKEAQALADEYVESEPDSVEKVNQILADVGLEDVEKSARDRKAQELVQDYAQHKPEAISVIHEFLAGAATRMDSLTADALVEHLNDIERIDHLTVIAESRRNTALREIERRRAVLGQTLRRSVDKVEEGEFEVIEAPSKGKNAA